MKRFADRVDPSNTNTTLRKSRSFATKTEAKAWGERVADQAEALGRIEIPLNMQIQILGIASQLQEAGGDPISLLMNATKIQKYGIDPIKALDEGANLVEVAEDHLEDTLGDWIESYANDQNQKKKSTHCQAVSNLRSTYVGLGEIKLKSFCNNKTAIEALTPVLQAYVDKDKVKRIESLQNLRARLRQLLKHTQRKTRIPKEPVLKHVTNLANYTELKHDLDEPKEDYALSAAEILVLIKHFSTEEHFCPSYPVVSALMGSRFSLYRELSWEMFGGIGRRGDSTVSIPKKLLKTVKQKKTNRGIQFKVSQIPNLEIWLWWCLYLEHRLEIKRDPRLPKESLRTMSEKKIRISRNKCLTDWEEFFEAPIEEFDEFSWGNAVLNGFRNSFITFGLKHPVVSKSCSKIANDWKSHQHYEDLGKAEPELEGKILFEINPTFLSLVDLEKKEVDTEFLYGNKRDRLKIIAQMPDDHKRLEYQSIMDSLEIQTGNDPDPFPDKDTEPEALEDELLMRPLDLNEKFFANVIHNKLFWIGWYEEIYSDR